ncbi:N-acetylmuramoyl-L-alanine amidase [Neptunicella marina]|uniref:N-acetylmuramoyl-L-alanine amidase n=1 Tax=Neptunicella marina TaxID=2125989 RepID=A0A8J6IUG1_9ALTE|nr:N-acetylmuramoyl-L-alanine amidase [Neptunicella marina]MBC3765836.1 N-acetylmuramoyl-L-alanine amidase [Neptunicella marina]
MSRYPVLKSLLLMWCLCTWSAMAADNKINSVRIWPSPDNTRVVFDLDSAPQYTYFTLSKPERLVIDLADTGGKFNFAGLANESDLVKKIRYSTPKNKRSVRLVVELTKKIKPQIFSLPPTAPYSDRLVIDLRDDDSQPSRQSSQQVVSHHADEGDDRNIIVAIDAGHGGEDPGSIGSAGTYEKNITLAIAKQLAKMIDAEQGMEAFMVRRGDYYVDLNRRTELARKAGADLFVSIHADAYTTPQPRGGSVWVLSMKRANSELGHWLEKREKYSELLGGAAEVIQNTDSERYLSQALLDMSMDHSMTTSYGLSDLIIGEMKKVTRMHKKAPQAASLAVLTSPDIPSILVETGFISNPTEEKNLNWSAHREKLAKAMFNAVKRHFKRTPPDGTLWARLKQQNRTHRVSRGESLSILAQRYNVSVQNLKVANNLNSDMVRIGQVLTIPSS